MSKSEKLAERAEIFGLVAKEYGKRALLGSAATVGYVYTGIKGVGFIPREIDITIAGVAGLKTIGDSFVAGAFTLARMATHEAIAEVQKREADSNQRLPEQFSEQ